MNLAFKILGYLFSILFLVAAVLQYNDPDALMWIFIWGISAVVSLLFALKKAAYNLTAVIAILALIAGFYVYPSTFEGLGLENGNLKNVERGREAYGLFIIAATMLIYTLRIRYVKMKSN